MFSFVFKYEFPSFDFAQDGTPYNCEEYGNSHLINYIDTITEDEKKIKGICAMSRWILNYSLCII